MKTYTPKESELNREWFVVDASDKILGRLAARIAHRLRGKHKPEFAPHMDNGDFLVVVNAEKVAVTGKKLDKKMYYKHTNHPGGIKERTLRQMLDKKPEEVLRAAVKGMLPKNRLARRLLNKLKVYAGAEHPHASQQPKPLDL
ncbi:50S ribosomal protein L13 [Desulfovibrio aminophilus]|nr:50S ribosomal protein L13 [Desulfovibrio aminophilus]MCM0754936.1 50S ribosomal protein L13 [Desulfovibrio aminophilus]